MCYRSSLAAALLACVVAFAATPNPAAAQQTGAVEGTVRDAGTGQAVSGAQVFVEETDLGSLTGTEGRYRISEVPTGQVAVTVRLIGYASSTRQIQVQAGQTATADFRLRRSAVEMESIIVTGTPGETVKREIGNAVSEIDAEELTDKSSSPNLESLLGERSGGVTVLPGSGNVGTASPIRLRGNASFTLSGQPLVYVDGVRINARIDEAPGTNGGTSQLADINMDDVRSIEIVKGPAATTLYGTEASNGVIQIITKSGSEGEPQVTVRTRQGANWFRNAEDRIPTNFNTTPDGDIVSQHLIESERAEGREVFQTGHSQSYDLSARGGSGGIGYFVSGSYQDQEGYVPNNWLTQFNTRVNLNSELPLGVNATNNLAYTSKTNAQHPQGFSGQQGIIDMIMFGIPRDPPTPSRGFLRSPPEESYKRDIRQEANRFIWSLNLRQSPTSWLSHRLRAGLDVTDQTDIDLWPRQAEGAAHFWGEQALGQKTRASVERRVRTLDYSATATADLTEDLTSETSVGLQFFGRKTERLQAFGQVFPTPDVTTISSAARRQSDETFVENKTLGMFLQEKFSWKQRLFVTVGLRADDNSAFGRDFEAVTYPKVNASWIISDEPFWEVGGVDNLRLRAAWGKAGQQPDAFAAIRTFSPITGPAGSPALEPDNPGNPELKPETTSEYEAGFEAGFVDDRVGVDFTYYRQRTSDALIEEPVAPSGGFGGSDRFINVAEIENWGLEANVRTTAVNTEQFGLDIATNLSHNQNEVTDLGDRPPILAGGFGTVWIREGYPIGGFHSRRVVEAEESEPGSGDFTRIRCDGGEERGHEPVPCADAPRIYLGPPGPLWTAGLDITATVLNQFRLFTSLNYHGNQRQFSITNFGRDGVFKNDRRVNPDERPAELRAEEALFITRQWVERQDYVGLREMSLTWTLPSSLSEAVIPGGADARVRLGAHNLSYPWIHSDFRDLDPAINRSGSQWQHTQQTMMPQPTRFTGELRLSF